MNREQVMAVLYDISLVIGGETSLQPLLTRTLQRILYHTSFPTGLVFLEPPEAKAGEQSVEVHLDAAVGDFGFAPQVGQELRMPAALLAGPPAVIEDAALLQALPGATRPYGVCLRLPIDHTGVLLLLAPRQPSTKLTLTQVFQPVMANLAKAILLCRRNDAYAAMLVAERDQAQLSLAESEEKFRSITAAAQDAIVMLDDAGQLVYWNPAAERTFGFTADEVLGHESHRLITPERYFEPFAKGFATFRKTGTGPVIGHTLEIEARRKDGSEFPVELSVSALRLNNRWHAVGILRDITARKHNEDILRQSKEGLRNALLGTIQSMALLVGKRDPYTASHQQNTARLAVAIARELGWPDDKVEGVQLGAMIHDLGMTSIPSEIIRRPDRLTELQFQLVKNHPQAGFEIIRDVAFAWPVAQIILQHHERLDGSGYPNGLSGDRIIPEARVVAVADVVEAMASHRPYRPAKGLEEALEEISNHRGSLYDAEVVDACLRLFRERGFSFDAAASGQT